MSKSVIMPNRNPDPAVLEAHEQLLAEAQAAVAAAEAQLASALAVRAATSVAATRAGMSIYRIAQVYRTDRNVVYNDLKRAQKSEEG